MCKWKQKDVKGIKKNAYIKKIQKKNDQILTVVDKTKLEKLEVYTDRFPMLHLRKQLSKIKIMIHLVSLAIIETKTFENISISVIILNSIVMVFNGSGDNSNPVF